MTLIPAILYKLRAVKLLCILTMTTVVVFAQHANANNTRAPTEAEIKLLPPYCQSKYNPNSPDEEHWKKTLGKTYQRIRHYCAALNFMSRYHMSTDKRKQSWLSNAIMEFGYMVTHSEPDSPLLHEIYLNRAIAYRHAKRDSEAIKDYYKAIELNPGQPRAYLDLANFFASKSLSKKALEVATQGLGHVPNNKSLQDIYIKHGGKLPYPEVLAKQGSQANTTPDKPTGTPVESDGVIVTKPGVEPSAPANLTSPAPEGPVRDAGQAQTPAAGTNKNPWCRFCPE